MSDSVSTTHDDNSTGDESGRHDDLMLRDLLYEQIFERKMPLMSEEASRQQVEERLSEMLPGILRFMDEAEIEGQEIFDHCLHWGLAGRIRGREFEIPLWLRPFDQIVWSDLRGWLQRCVKTSVDEFGIWTVEGPNRSYENLVRGVSEVLADCPACRAYVALERVVVQADDSLRLEFDIDARPEARVSVEVVCRGGV